jgi:membrane protease YdiL (CAAX protease family)
MKMIKNSTLSFGKVHLIQYFILIFVFAIPFWVLGFLVSNGLLAGLGIPTNIPISALMFIVPIGVASILVYKEHKLNGVKQLLKRAYDYNRTKKHKIWYLPALLLMPIIAVFVYITMRLIGLPLPTPYIPFLLIPFFLFIFYFSVVGEEIGWSGYAIDPMQNCWGALKASIILGLVWATWHVVHLFRLITHPLG